MKKLNVKNRRETIKKIIETEKIENQNEIAKILFEKYSININQSIISRDLSKIGVNKKKNKDSIKYDLNNENYYKEIFLFGIKKILYNEFLIVVNTVNALSDFTSDYIDKKSSSDLVIGTISGEDTVIVIPRSIKNIQETYAFICNILYFKENKDDK